MSRDQIEVEHATTLAPSQQQQALYDHLDRPAHTSYMIPPIISSDQHRPAPIVYMIPLKTSPTTSALIRKKLTHSLSTQLFAIHLLRNARHALPSIDE
ncbi:hypothetical protein PGT21_018493 [Puccinia graminis f. sp. tritici]|uniref:Uncharacterized protein n=1 Tax=Puccinia graminis f. sp. tritici TaxID=56615 RepID=A0A5B0QI98_PUCGR|nr:hypothetical protein PGT21_018493 [Puccinia graminis f. sp. tritici]